MTKKTKVVRIFDGKSKNFSWKRAKNVRICNFFKLDTFSRGPILGWQPRAHLGSLRPCTCAELYLLENNN